MPRPVEPVEPVRGPQNPTSFLPPMRPVKKDALWFIGVETNGYRKALICNEGEEKRNEQFEKCKLTYGSQSVRLIETKKATIQWLQGGSTGQPEMKNGKVAEGTKVIKSRGKTMVFKPSIVQVK